MCMQKRTRQVLGLLLSLAVILSFSACGGGASSAAPPSANTTAESASVTASAPQGSSAPALAGGVTVVDQAGREVTIEGSIERIVSGYYISSSACIALGLTDRMVGIEAKADSRPLYAMAAPQMLELPNVGTAKEFNMEGCIALEPDLVILPKRLKDSADTLADLGINVVLVSPESHEDLVGMLELIGEATGTQDAATQLVSYYSDELTTVAALTKDLAEKPTVYMGGNSSYLETAPKDMYQASLIDTAGGINAAADIDGNNWTAVSYEQLVAMNPDVIVIPCEASYTKEEVVGDAQLVGISAVKEGRVYQMPRDFEAWDSPVPSCTLGIRWMLNALHEDVYSLEELRTDAADFYEEFYGAQIDTSLIGA